MAKARSKKASREATGASKKTAKKSAPTSKRRASINDLVRQLDQQDRDLVKMFHERARLALKLAKQRTAEGQPAFSLSEEEERIRRAIRAGRGPLPSQAVRAALRELVSGCRKLHRAVRVAFLGPLYSYSHLAATARFGQSVDLAPVGSIAAVFEEVNRRHSDFGLVPIENSTDGRIADTLDMFTRLPVRICGEVELEIHHALLGKCPRDQLREVYSRPQALSQCRNWLAKHLPSARTIEVTSTSTAAQLALEKPGAAAIASVQAGIHYGLDVLVERVEDNPNNSTRFAVIGDHVPQPSGNDRTAMFLQTEHRFGALAEALGVFKRNRLNLTWIESFPVPGSARTYLFFVEVEAHESEPTMRRCVEALRDKTLRLEVLGSFPAAEPEV